MNDFKIGFEVVPISNTTDGHPNVLVNDFGVVDIT